MIGASSLTTFAFLFGACCATYSCRKSYQRLKVCGSIASTCAPLVKVNHFLLVPVKCCAKLAQCPPVCSSCHWQARKTGTLIFLTKVSGSSASATEGT